MYQNNTTPSRWCHRLSFDPGPSPSKSCGFPLPGRRYPITRSGWTGFGRVKGLASKKLCAELRRIGEADGKSAVAAAVLLRQGNDIRAEQRAEIGDDARRSIVHRFFRGVFLDLKFRYRRVGTYRDYRARFTVGAAGIGRGIQSLIGSREVADSDEQRHLAIRGERLHDPAP